MATERILLVEDDTTLLETYSRVLRRAGYDVLPADGPRRALEIVRRNDHNNPIPVVLSDVAMPEMRGTELVREVAQLSPLTVPLLMTAGLYPADAPEGVTVLRKPLSTCDLLGAVKTVLRRSTELSEELRKRRQRAAELQQRSKELIDSAKRVTTESSETILKSKELRKKPGSTESADDVEDLT